MAKKSLLSKKETPKKEKAPKKQAAQKEAPVTLGLSIAALPQMLLLNVQPFEQRQEDMTQVFEIKLFALLRKHSIRLLKAYDRQPVAEVLFQ